MVRNTKKSFLSLVLFLLGIFSSQIQAANLSPTFILPFPFLGQKDSVETMDTGVFENDAGSRSYRLYVPQGIKPKPGLLVVLHGCFLSPEQMAAGTDLNSYASKFQFIVLYPEQTFANNPWKCWNWFKPENQIRNKGEISILAGMTQEIIKKFKVDTTKVFAAGISAGGAMVSNLLACYSDIFRGGMVHSGLEYEAAKSEEEAHQVTSSGSARNLDETAANALKCSPLRSKLLPIMSFQGSTDAFVNPINSERIMGQFERVNKSIYKTQNNVEAKIEIKESKLDPGNYLLTADVKDVLFNDEIILRKILVNGMGHAWSGGQPNAPYMEPRGVNASEILTQFFFGNRERLPGSRPKK